MDAKARQDCIKEIDLLKVKKERRETASCAVLSSLKVPQMRPSTTEKQLISTRLPGFLVWGDMQTVHVSLHRYECREVFYAQCVCVCVCVFICVCVEPVLHPSRLTLTVFLNAKNVVLVFFLSSFCNVSSRVTVDQQENLALSLLMFHLLPFLSLILLFLFWRKWFHLSNRHKTRVSWVALK